MSRQKLLKFYNLSKKVIYCTKCTISNQRPRTLFDKNGVCSACNYAEYKQSRIDWDKREKKLKALCNKFRSKDGSFDVVVPSSGGKDSGFVAHQLKYKYGMNPLCVTWSPMQYTDIGRQNLESFIDSGFNHILGTPDRKTSKKLTKAAFKEMGDPFMPFIYGQMNFPLKIAVQYQIPLVMYGENGEAEYGGEFEVSNQSQRYYDKDFFRLYFSGRPIQWWLAKGLSSKDLRHYMPPSFKEFKKNKTEIHFFGFYKFWDPQENYYYAQQNTGFFANTERTEGTFSKYASLDDAFDGFHYYLMYIKMGIGRATSDSAHEIRDKKITRDEGIMLVKKFDGEFPQKNYIKFLEFCDITENDFIKIVDSWRLRHIWKKSFQGRWELKNPIWKNK